MKRTKQARRDARQLYYLCLENGVLDPERVRQVAQRVSESHNRNRLHVLAEFRRFVKLDAARHTATVESASPLAPELRTVVQAGLERIYGPGLNTSFAHIPALIGGMRVRVGSDVYDGSVQGRLADLEANL